MYDLLKRKNKRTREYALEFARDLIRTPSVSLQENEVADRVEQEMEELLYDEVLRDDAGNVVGVMRGRENGPTLLLNCHMDTVGVDSEKEWNKPPFGAEVDRGRLYGRGAADCKGGLAAQVYAAALLKRALLPLKGNIVVAATVAEENGRSVGVRELISRTLPDLKLEPDYAILGEPTHLALYYGHDGWVELELQIKGSDPFQVDDAAQAIHAELQSEMESPSDAADRQDADVREPWFEGQGGTRRARISMDSRLRSADELEKQLRRVQRNATLVADSVGAVAVDVTVGSEQQTLYTGRTVTVRNVTHAWSIDPFHSLMGRARSALQAAGCPARAGTWHLDRLRMGTAGSVLVNEFNIPTIGYGPGSEVEAHSPDECVEVDNLNEAIYGTAAIAHKLVGIPVFGWPADEI